MATLKAIFGLLDDRVKTALGDQVGAMRTWQLGDLSEQPPDPSALPWLRLSPHPGASERAADDAMRSPMLVRVETTTEGYDAGASMDFWELVRDAMTSAALKAELAEMGVSRVTVLVPAYGVKDHYHRWEFQTPGSIYADGLVELEMYVDA